MSRMLSREEEPSKPSEKIVFEALKDADHTEDWTVFHSTYISAPSKPAREIDFVVIIPEDYSVICLEVKGGGYKINADGRWSTAKGVLLKESPHDKVKDDMYALKNNFKVYFHSGGPGGGNKLSIGCAVALVDMDEPTPPLCEHLAESIWSSDVIDQDKLVKKLKEIAQEISPPYTRFPSQKERAEKNLANLLDELSPEDTIIPGARIFSPDLKTLRKKLLGLTNDQFRSLGIVKRNARCVIDGAAGTGKTVLAMELARQRCEEEGKKVALICSNPYLSSHFARWAKTLSNDKGGKVVAGTLEHFSPFDSQEQEKFCYLIVDEAQNMCDEESRNSMGNLLEGGLTDGNWAMFGDFTHQNIINPNINKTGEDVVEELKNIYGITHDKLEINCRNTYEISAAVSMFLGIESLPRSGVHGPRIQMEFFDSRESLDVLLNRLVSDLKEREFSSQQIILLSSGSDDFNTEPPREYGEWRLLNVSEAEAEEGLGREDVLNVNGDSASSPITLRYSNIHDFQGLESEVVILVLPLTEEQTKLGDTATLPDYLHLRKVLYVGMSRAKAILIIVAEESYKNHLELKPRFRTSYGDLIEESITQSRILDSQDA